MKVDKSKSKVKGKGEAQSSPRTQTITSMFKKQTAAAKKPATSPCKSISGDDEVIVIGEVSPYFKEQSSKDRSKASVRRSLSLKRSRKSNVVESNPVIKEEITSLETPWKDDEKKVSMRESLSSKHSVKNMTGTNKNSSPSNDANTSCLKDTVGFGEGDILESSQKENSGDFDTNRKSSLIRKRKSDTILESPCDANDKKCKTVENDTSCSVGIDSYLDTGQTHSQMTSRHGMKNSDVSDNFNLDKCSEQGFGNSPCVLKHSKSFLSFSAKEKQKLSVPRSKTKPDKDKLAASPSLLVSDSSTKDLDNEEHSQEVEDEVEDKSSEFRTPYYLENFRTVLKTVFDDENHRKLYNTDDMAVIATFNELSESAQKLYLRLFCRKWTWFPLNKIKYPRIAEDLLPIVEELTDQKLLVTDIELYDLGLTLKLLSGGDIKTLGKMYHITTTSQSKMDITDLLLKKTKQNTIGSMFKMAGNSPETIMLNRAKKLLGCCIHVAEEPRNVFARTLMLFSLTDTVLDEDSSGQSLQLFQMLRVNIGQVIYPTFTVNKQTQVFPDREALLRFCEASLLEFDILTKLERNKYNEAFCVYQTALQQYDQLIKDKKWQRFDRKLPVFLRPYTACGVYTRALNQGVEILQRQKDYQAAVDLLTKLLHQNCYCQHYRGHWWERLALNYDIHLKRQDLALQAAKDGLNDKLCRTGRRLALYQRAEKICSAAKSKYKARMKEFQHDKLVELPKVTIEGQTLSDNIEGQKYKFMIACNQENGQTDSDDFAFCCVEEVVLDHYKHNGFTDGVHAEGSVISCLFGLFFWDILFMDVPDVFHSPYQAHPLDLHTEDFYVNRQSHVDKRLSKIESSSTEELKDMVADTWQEHEGTLCAGLNWERFNNLEHVQGLVECIGGKILSGILGRYVKDPRHTRSGFPDLTLWNTDTKHFKISEVKGPNDKLSHKQIMWLDYLLKLGVDAEVCHVKAVGSKRLKKTQSDA